MKKQLAVIGCLIIGGALLTAQASPNAKIEASYTSAWDVAANGGFGGNTGFGFGPWQLSTTGGGSLLMNGGFDIWNSKANSSSTATRSFNSPLAVGASFSVQLRFGTLDSSALLDGIQLQDAGGNVLFSYYHQGGDGNDGHFTDTRSSGTAAGFSYNYNNFSTYTFTLKSATTYIFTDNTTGASFTGTLSGAPITKVVFFRKNGNYTPDDGQDFIFDDLVVTSPWTDMPIFTHPLSYNGGIVGSTATLGTTVVSLKPLTYQWYREGVAIAGATNANLVLTNLNTTLAGNYWVVAATSAGSVTSAVSVVTIYQENSRLLAYEGFNYTPDNLNQQNGGTGWGSAWSKASGNNQYFDLDSLAGGPNVPSGYDANSQGNFFGTFGGGRAGRFLDCAPSGVFAQSGYLDADANVGGIGKTLYVSFLQQPGVPSAFYEFEFSRGALGEQGRVAGLGNATATNDVYFRAPNGVMADLGGGDSVVNFFVVRIDFKDGNDIVRIYRNPTSTLEPSHPTAMLTNVGNMSFNAVTLGADTNYVAIDEIRMGTTWSDAIGQATSNMLSPTRVPGGWGLQFAATPNLAYHVMRSMSVTGPWTDIGTVTGPINGVGTFFDSGSTSQAFYRLINYAPGDVHTVEIASSTMIGQGMAEFVPAGFDATKTPSLSLLAEPASAGPLASGWSLVPQFTVVNGNACASLAVPSGTSLYGGGEVSGPLLRNGQTIKIWNTDCADFTVDAGRRLYQAHPWVLGLRPDGSAFGVLFDTSYKASLTTGDSRIDFQSHGTLFRVFIIDRASPKAVMQGLAALTGTLSMPPRWAIGYHQCRFSYTPASQVQDIADTFLSRQIPCDSVWMDIDYMNAFRDFTFNPATFANPPALFTYLHSKGFHAVCLLDPNIAVDSNYSVYKSGTASNIWTQTARGKEWHGGGYAGTSAFPDFTYPAARSWWATLCQNFMTNGMDGLWTDANEPPGGEMLGTMPYDNQHRGGGGLPAGSHLLYHNAYGLLEAQATYQGELAANPNRRPFILSRANFLGGQRFAAAWTGDNASTTNDMLLSIPMALTLSLSGQPFSGPDLGGFFGNPSPDLYGNWIGFGAFLPFCRGHAMAGTIQKEPWAFGTTVENAARIALDRRYRLLPYYYTLFHNSALTGAPIMLPVFFADPKDLSLRAEQQAFLLGSDLLVVPSWATNCALPGGIWRPFSLVSGDSGIYQAQLKIRGGAILPVGTIVQNTTQNSFNPLTLVVCLDSNGAASGTLYWDAGDGWSFQTGGYSLQYFTAKQAGNIVTVRLDHTEGSQTIPESTPVTVQIITANGVASGSGSTQSGITINL